MSHLLRNRRRTRIVVITAALVAAFAIVGVALAAAPFIVDHFTDGPQNVFCNAPCTLSSSVGPGLAVPGGFRNVTITAGGTPGRQLQVLVDPVNSSTLSFNQATGEGGTAHVVWDGTNNPAVFNPIGLRGGGPVGIDLTQANTNTGIVIRVPFDDLAINVTVRLYTNGTDWSQTVFNLPGGILTPAQALTLYVPFSSFTVGGGAGATATNIGAITMDIDGTVTQGADMELDIVEAGGYDFGDLPAAYTVTTLNPPNPNQNGARHLIGPLHLGTIVDAELDGQPSPNATGDDTNPLGGVNDEDGVIRTPGVKWVRGSNGSLNVTVAGCTGTCRLNGWIDFNGNNSLTDAGENVFADLAVTNGTQTLTFPIPGAPTTPLPTLNARFRLCDTAGTCNALTGAVYNGEVEDYQWTFSATAVTLNSLQAQPTTTSPLLPVALVGVSAAALIGVVLFTRRVRRKTS